MSCGYPYTCIPGQHNLRSCLRLVQLGDCLSMLCLRCFARMKATHRQIMQRELTGRISKSTGK